MRDYKQLEVWQRSMALGIDVYSTTAGFPKTERFEIVSQLRRAVLSVPSNIAEANGRTSPRSQLRLLDDSRGSLYEVETQLIFSQRIGLLSTDRASSLLEEVGHVMRLLNGLIRAVKRRCDRTA
jgi:four helix bundle protein